MASKRIHIRVSSENAYVWNVDDIAALRSSHHIGGILTGTLPHVSQQNVFLGLPLMLMPEEVVLLLEKELAVLVDDTRTYSEPSTAELRRWDTERKAAIQLQAGKETTTDVAKKSRALTGAAVQKRKEREEKRLKLNAIAAAATDGLSPGPSHLAEVEALPSSTTSDHTQPHSVVVPTESSFEWYRPDGCTFSTLESAKAAGIWNFPATLHEKARCAVFRDLWEQGYFMGSGIKFGGDYLVYPGDSLRYHSHFVASVIDSPATAIRAMEVVAHGRLGTATKKAHLLCGWNDEKQEVSYFSIEWAGFG